jgi:hypothetical protein
MTLSLFSTFHTANSWLCGNPVAAAFSIPLWSWALARKIKRTRNPTGCVLKYLMCVLKELTTLEMQMALWWGISLNFHTKTAQFSEINWYLGTPHQPYEVMGKGVRRRSLVGTKSRCQEKSCMTPWMQMPRIYTSSQIKLSVISLPSFITSRSKQQFSGRQKMWKMTSFLSLRECRGLTVSLIPSEVPSTTTNFNLLS